MVQNKVLLIRHWGQWWKLQRIFFRLKANYPLWSRNSQWRKICFHFLCMYFVVWLWIKWFQLNEISDYYPHLCHTKALWQFFWSSNSMWVIYLTIYIRVQMENIILIFNLFLMLWSFKIWYLKKDSLPQ